MESSNPYQSPAAAVTDALADAGRPLFRTSGVFIATIMGSILAGGWVIGMNHAARGEFRQARMARLYAVLGAIALMTLSLLLPEQVPGVVYLIPQLVAINYWVKRAQGEAIDARVAAGLPMRSNWLAAGIGLLGALVVVAIAIATVGIAVYGFGVELG
ncbi:hypothetical protein [Pseudomonas sp. CGJS7]|uniref:hypothetical protein n=1 Tax=Pseudomonas sp. CGJS7 TaxID=3109348 RepID=UPI003009B669